MASTAIQSGDSRSSWLPDLAVPCDRRQDEREHDGDDRGRDGDAGLRRARRPQRADPRQSGRPRRHAAGCSSARRRARVAGEAGPMRPARVRLHVSSSAIDQLRVSPRPGASSCSARGATLAVAAFILAVGPEPGDAPAHLYRTFLVEHGIVLWDNLWYAGQYPLASYSLLYYFPAAAVGNLPLVLGAAVAATLLFALISYREWGPSARWPTRIFGVLAAAPMFTGLYPTRSDSPRC